MSKTQKTIESFEHQWKNLPSGECLLSDKKWIENVDKYILQELQMTADEIRGKKILDAGCGQGRWAYGFEKLGCEVYGFDISMSAVEYAEKYVNGKFWVWDILTEAEYQQCFDIIWCWGVIHHTPDPKKAVSNLVQLLKPGGALHLMVYAKKSRTNRFLRWVFNWFGMRWKNFLTRTISWLTGRSKHSVFDSFSPPISSNHTFEEVEKWLHGNGLYVEFVEPEWAGDSKDIYVNGYKGIVVG